ncbi:guanine nucleotide exchange protein for ADP-robosylation factor [Coemansia brasiliensis]|uniref:Guanine nucleotide exchange protein for ADP-robosylation factor n=1 Tax=Coemansia brasiliensis TaxID=2650707 RepID=A0A9W8I896_9FUNG|nr:guanine nucleotide exchange protein for ADP-robosylation factor [Coemansia brasiliensis]
MAAADIGNEPDAMGHLAEKEISEHTLSTETLQAHTDRKTPNESASIAILVDPQQIISQALQQAKQRSYANTQAEAAQQIKPQVELLSGLVFITKAMEKLQATREGKRRELKAALERVQLVLQPRVHSEQATVLNRSEVDEIMQVLSLACDPQNSSAGTTAIALDCIEKLVSFRYFDQVQDAPNAEYYAQIAARLVEITARSFRGEGTADAVLVQIVKALFALLSSERLAVRQAAMLAAVRTAYNVFVAARGADAQIAQGTVTQMVRLVMARASQEEESSSGDMHARDAFLLLRALCRLAMRQASNEHQLDARAPQLRSRCLALNLLRLALAEHTAVFLSSYVYLRSTPAAGETEAPADSEGDEFGDVEGPERAISDFAETASQQQRAAAAQAVAVPVVAVVRQYLTLALSRSLASPHAMVQDLGLAIFELALRHARMYLRREIEVLVREIVLPVLESRSAGSLHQRGRLLQTLARVLAQPDVVVELYLNYDCAEDMHTNAFQRLAEVLCKLGASFVNLPPKGSPRYSLAADSADSANEAVWRAVQQRQTVFSAQQQQQQEHDGTTGVSQAALAYGGLAFDDNSQAFDEYAVRQLALDALAAMLQSMVTWSDRLAELAPPSSEDDGGSASPVSPAERETGAETGDDPQELQSIKTRKAQMEAGLRQFAWKPRRGIEAWRAAGLLVSNDPVEVACFLFTHRDSIDKVQLGEFLGEGDAHNVAVMHAFIDQMDFARMSFVPALRKLLQAFRLPGEAQKIDRFMLKFAERYVMGNPDVGFANADAAYVLAYSTILLNTDQHSPQVRHRMTRADFVSNNRGINDGADLPLEMLHEVFDQVANEEIKLKNDPLQQQQQYQGPAVSSRFVLFGNNSANRIREHHAHVAAEMASKSEQSIRDMARMRRQRQQQQQQQRKRRMSDSADSWAVLLDMADYLHATRTDHIAPMFSLVWTAVLAALSSPMQTSSDPHVVSACLVGLQCGIALACRFRMPLERATFVTTLRNFTLLQNLAEMRRKHVEAIRALVEVAASRPDVGDGLNDNWLDVLQCVSQLERLQLLTQGPEQARRASARVSSESNFPLHSTLGGSSQSLLSSVLSVSAPLSSQTAESIPARAFVSREQADSGGKGGNNVEPTVLVAELAKLETNSQALVVAVDRLFTASVRLSGAGIVDFVRALSQVAWGEITSTFASARSSLDGAAYKQQQRRQSSLSMAPSAQAPSRLFSMTKIVEIAYYNMSRIRVEWSQIWAILGPLFDRVGGYSDTRAAVFALDSLRQLSMKFLEKEELPHFAFQKEFLRPFADILEGYIPESASELQHQSKQRAAAEDLLVKDMVLRCVHQLVQAAASHIRSGWKAVLNVAQIAARDSHDQIAEMGFFVARECALHHGKHMWALAIAQVQTEEGHQDSSSSTEEVVTIMGLEYFHELIDCLNEFSMVRLPASAAARRSRFALSAIDTMCSTAESLSEQILMHPKYKADVKVSMDDQPLYRVWMPVLRALYEVVMHTEDLEVRTRALDAFYRLMMQHGRHFSSSLWTHTLRSLVFPMFADLRDPSNSKRFATIDDLELWFSTSLIKALRHVVALYTEYFPQQLTHGMMGEVLELLVLCIAQPSEVLGKVGTSCLQDMIKANYFKWDSEAWDLVCSTLSRLFSWSQPRELFSVAGASWEAENKKTETLPAIVPKVPKQTNETALHSTNRPSPLRTAGSAASLLSSTTDGNDTPSPISAASEANAAASPPVITKPIVTPSLLPRSQKQANKQSGSKPDYVFITLKCILQLLLIQTLGELFGINVESGSLIKDPVCDDLYQKMSAHHLFILLDCLDQSRSFAHRFNQNRQVRRRLVELGVMPTMPSLLKQETGSALMELYILQRMQADALGIPVVTGQRDKAAKASADKVKKERETVIEQVDDRLSQLMQMGLAEYCGRKESSENTLYIVSLENQQDSESTDAKKQMVMTTAWRPLVLSVLQYFARESSARLFKSTVLRLWPDLVEIIGVATDVGDRDIIGTVQKILIKFGPNVVSSTD